MSDRPMNDEALQERFREDEFGYATWSELAPTFARGVLVYVDPALDFGDAATAVEKDDSAKVQQWMADGKLHNVTDEQAQAWTDGKEQMFRFLIRQPLVLAQPIPFEP